jgi:predicted Holliday junction resolvase-like endonuclease
MKYGKSGIWRKIISSPFILLIILLFFIFLVKVVWAIREKVVISNSRLYSTNAELLKLQTHQNDLSKKISYLSTEQGIEAELRTKYRAIREGESVAVIVDRDQASSSLQLASSSPKEIEDLGWWDKVLQIIGFK